MNNYPSQFTLPIGGVPGVGGDVALLLSRHTFKNDFGNGSSSFVLDPSQSSSLSKLIHSKVP